MSTQEMTRLYTDGLTLVAIGQRFGITKQAVRGRLRRAGVVDRTPGRPLGSCKPPEPSQAILQAFHQLDTLSRQRALTHKESVCLERLVNIIDGKKV